MKLDKQNIMNDEKIGLGDILRVLEAPVLESECKTLGLELELEVEKVANQVCRIVEVPPEEVVNSDNWDGRVKIRLELTGQELQIPLIFLYRDHELLYDVHEPETPRDSKEIAEKEALEKSELYDNYNIEHEIAVTMIEKIYLNYKATREAITMKRSASQEKLARDIAAGVIQTHIRQRQSIIKQSNSPKRYESKESYSADSKTNNDNNNTNINNSEQKQITIPRPIIQSELLETASSKDNDRKEVSSSSPPVSKPVLSLFPDIPDAKDISNREPIIEVAPAKSSSSLMRPPLSSMEPSMKNDVNINTNTQKQVQLRMIDKAFAMAHEEVKSVFLQTHEISTLLKALGYNEACRTITMSSEVVKNLTNEIVGKQSGAGDDGSIITLNTNMSFDMGTELSLTKPEALAASLSNYVRDRELLLLGQDMNVAGNVLGAHGFSLPEREAIRAIRQLNALIDGPWSRLRASILLQCYPPHAEVKDGIGSWRAPTEWRADGMTQLLKLMSMPPGICGLSPVEVLQLDKSRMIGEQSVTSTILRMRFHLYQNMLEILQSWSDLGSNQPGPMTAITATEMPKTQLYHINASHYANKNNTSSNAMRRSASYTIMPPRANASPIRGDSGSNKDNMTTGTGRMRGLGISVDTGAKAMRGSNSSNRLPSKNPSRNNNHSSINNIISSSTSKSTQYVQLAAAADLLEGWLPLNRAYGWSIPLDVFSKMSSVLSEVRAEVIVMSDGSRFKAIKGATWVRIGDILGIDTILFCSELADYDICKASECCIAVPNSCVFPCTYAEYLCTQKLRANDVKEGDLAIIADLPVLNTCCSRFDWWDRPQSDVLSTIANSVCEIVSIVNLKSQHRVGILVECDDGSEILDALPLDALRPFVDTKSLKGKNPHRMRIPKQRNKNNRSSKDEDMRQRMMETTGDKTPKVVLKQHQFAWLNQDKINALTELPVERDMEALNAENAPGLTVHAFESARNMAQSRKIILSQSLDVDSKRKMVSRASALIKAEQEKERMRIDINDEDSTVVKIPVAIPLREFDASDIPRIPSSKQLHDEEAARLSPRIRAQVENNLFEGAERQKYVYRYDMSLDLDNDDMNLGIEMDSPPSPPPPNGFGVSGLGYQSPNSKGAKANIKNINKNSWDKLPTNPLKPGEVAIIGQAPSPGGGKSSSNLRGRKEMREYSWGEATKSSSLNNHHESSNSNKQRQRPTSGHPSRRPHTSNSQTVRGDSSGGSSRPLTADHDGNGGKATLHINNDLQPFPEFEKLDKEGVRALVEVQVPLNEITTNNNRNGRRIIGSTTHTAKDNTSLDEENIDPLPQDVIDPSDPLGIKGVAHYYKDRREYREKLDLAIAKEEEQERREEEEERKLQQAMYERGEELIDEELVLLAEEQMRKRREASREGRILDRTANLKSEEAYLREQEVRGQKDSLSRKEEQLKRELRRMGVGQKK